MGRRSGQVKGHQASAASARPMGSGHRPTLTAAEAAALLGRTADWLYRNHKILSEREGFPPPLVSRGELTWATVHLHAWLDRELAPSLRRHVQALRLAEAAVAGTPEAAEVADWSARLMEQFPSST